VSGARVTKNATTAPGDGGCFFQWRRQCSKGARSFQGQKILQPAHPGALFSSAFLFSVYTVTEAKQYTGLEPGQWIFHPARSFVLVPPGVAPPLVPSVHWHMRCGTDRLELLVESVQCHSELHI